MCVRWLDRNQAQGPALDSIQDENVERDTDPNPQRDSINIPFFDGKKV